MLGASSEAAFATEICRVAVEVAGYALAWVGYPEYDARRSVRAIAQWGFDDGYIGLAAVSWSADDEHGRGPTGTALRTGRPQIAQHIDSDPRLTPWRADALRRGYKSSASFPLRDGEAAFGTLNLYAPESDGFDDVETELLGLVADDLAHGILGLRGRESFDMIQRALDHADRLVTVGRAAATLAHDVNNHLTIALLSAEHVASRIRGPDQASLEDALAAIGRAIALNRDLLRMAGKSLVAPKVFEPDAMLRELEPALRRACGPNVTLRLEPGAQGASVRMDPRAFEQTLANLVVNARDAMTTGGSVTIATSVIDLRHPLPREHVAARPGSYVSLRVIDTGPGIPPETIERVFEPFFTTKGSNGTGLGLASALGSAHQAGGDLTVLSEPGKGAAFELLLPRVTDAA